MKFKERRLSNLYWMLGVLDVIGMSYYSITNYTTTNIFTIVGIFIGVILVGVCAKMFGYPKWCLKKHKLLS